MALHNKAAAAGWRRSYYLSAEGFHAWRAGGFLGKALPGPPAAPDAKRPPAEADAPNLTGTHRAPNSLQMALFKKVLLFAGFQKRPALTISANISFFRACRQKSCKLDSDERMMETVNR